MTEGGGVAAVDRCPYSPRCPVEEPRQVDVRCPRDHHDDEEMLGLDQASDRRDQQIVDSVEAKDGPIVLNAVLWSGRFDPVAWIWCFVLPRLSDTRPTGAPSAVAGVAPAASCKSVDVSGESHQPTSPEIDEGSIAAAAKRYGLMNVVVTASCLSAST